MVNTKSILLGLALALSASALPVEQEQISNCKGEMKMNGTSTDGTSAIHGAVGDGNTGPKTVTSGTSTASSIAVSKTVPATTASVKPTTSAVVNVPTTAAAAVKPSSTIVKVSSTAPAAKPSSTNAAVSFTSAQLLKIAPDTSSCAGAPFPAECADASKAAPAIAKSFTKYGFTTPGEQAALIALMLYESGSFKYNKNHYPGRPGQGTRNMQVASFNQKYAAEIKGAAAAAAAGADILSLLSDDESSFGSAAWYLKTQCGPNVAKGLQGGTSVGWDAYLTGCVGTTHTPDRDVSWTAAKKVLGV